MLEQLIQFWRKVSGWFTVRVSNFQSEFREFNMLSNGTDHASHTSGDGSLCARSELMGPWLNFKFQLGDIMGLRERDKTDTNPIQESRQAMPAETSPMAKESPNPTNRAPDLRRRALIAGLATTPVLLSLSNRSALGQTVDCSLLSSIILGGSVNNLPNGWEHKGPEFIENYYQTHCVEGGDPGTGNATGNTGRTTNGTGNSN